VRGCVAPPARGGPYAAACAAAVRLSGEHPGDLGVVASLLLRHAVLEPGDAVYLPAGGLHAYLHGTGVELLANSDNVVRAGLTPKHIDVPELLKLTDPAVAVPVLEPRPLGDGVFGYDSFAPEFRLYRAELGRGEAELPGTWGPRIVLSAEGTAVLRASGDAAAAVHGADLTVARGESCFLAAADGVVTATGPAALFIAASGL
jgi:mannose-6-phosphate isomerase